MAGTGLGLCMMVGFCFSSAEMSGSVTTVLVS